MNTYYADKAEAGGKTVTPEHPEATDKVAYKELGKTHLRLTQMATQFQVRQLHNIRIDIQTIQSRVESHQHQSSQVM
ncbi:MAG: hypothetical protein ACLVJN_08010 [Streptococcus parasanguinis]